MNVEQWKITDIIPYELNPRVNDAAVDAVARSIQEFGFRQPIVVDADGVIIVGHTRWKAAQQLGLETVPVHIATDLSPEQIRAYRIADNQTGNIAEWDAELLPIELSELRDLDFDMSLLGFSDDELAMWLDPGVEDGLTDPDEIPEPPDEPITQPGDLWSLGDHRLLCGDGANPEHVDRLLDSATIHLVNTDPPYNVRVEPRSNNAIAAGLSSFSNDPAAKKLKSGQGNAAFDVQRGKTKAHRQTNAATRHSKKTKGTRKKMRAKDRPLENDFVSDEQFDELLQAWFGNVARVLNPGRAFYIWGGYANCANYPPVLKASNLYFSQAIIWVKEHPVLTRKDFMGNHEWCQPADTMVKTPDGSVPIASLRKGDHVIAYSRKHNTLIGLRNGGVPVTPTARAYSGPLLGVDAGEKTTWCTPGHLWSVKLAPEADKYWCVYLMQKDRWWRVGKSKLLSTWGFGVKHRLKTEGGDYAWILSVHDSSLEAAIAEQLILAQYGVPTTTWSESASSRRTIADVSRLYDRLDLAQLDRNARRALADHGRSIDHPFLSAPHTRRKVGRRTSLVVRACNLLPEVMMVPVPQRGQQTRWQPLRAIQQETFKGTVYSMDVPQFRHYIADGLVTHNCFYGWREGAAHQFLGPNNAPDVWTVKKVSPQKMIHLTEKPVELAIRAMQYSSRVGENVLDLFGGSGSTLIAAQQTGRNAFLMELDAAYCDVIVERWENFTGKKAKRQPEIPQTSKQSPEISSKGK